jgi:cellulose synthase/poly-beta-1,6-N-acetylglucosamine synthase-like glycosyltransferase
MDPLSAWKIAVVIPARNEAGHIGGCLNSILAASRHCTLASECYIVVVADSCDDATAAMAQDVLSDQGQVLACRAGSVGTARQLGTLAALTHLQGHPPARIWLANTDADTEVPEDWLQRQMELAVCGYQGVAGIVEIGAVGYRGEDISAALMADYQVLPDGSHPHVHGANLGLRADAYLSAGGWSDAALAEDHCLWQRVRGNGLRVATSAGLCVRTSGRLEGRAEGGFATTLRKKVERLHV